MIERNAWNEFGPALMLGVGGFIAAIASIWLMWSATAWS
jgi:hypothetical protein